MVSSLKRDRLFLKTQHCHNQLVEVIALSSSSINQLIRRLSKATLCSSKASSGSFCLYGMQRSSVVGCIWLQEIVGFGHWKKTCPSGQMCTIGELTHSEFRIFRVTFHRRVCGCSNVSLTVNHQAGERPMKIIRWLAFWRHQSNDVPSKMPIYHAGMDLPLIWWVVEHRWEATCMQQHRPLEKEHFGWCVCDVFSLDEQKKKRFYIPYHIVVVLTFTSNQTKSNQGEKQTNKNDLKDSFNRQCEH